MTLLATLLAIALFALCLSLLRIVPTTQRISADALRAVSVMRAEDRTDDAKEREIRKAALTLFGLFFSITLRSAVALTAPVAAVQVLDLADVVKAGDVYRLLASWPVILGAVACFGAVHWLLNR